MEFEIEKQFFDDDIGKIGIASIISAVTAVMMVNPDYQVFSLVEGQFWFNIFRLIGDASLIVIIIFTLIEIILKLLKFLRNL